METLITTLFTPMLDLAIEECRNVFNLKDDISNLQNSILLIKVVLQDAEKRQDNEDAIKQWLGQLDDIVFDARNVLDDFVIYTHSKRHKIHKHKINRFKLARKIKDINGRLEKVIKQKEILNLRPSEATRTDKAGRVESGYLADAENLFVGRDEIKQSMLDQILANHSREETGCQVRFIPIWGMGGIGKTTLAQSIYNDYSRITEQDYPRKGRKWICVGEKEFDAKRIMKEIVNEKSADYQSVATLQEHLVNKLNADGGGRFLIVLDDVWCIKRNEWNLIWRSLATIQKGGVVIMTTRLKDVIANTGNTVQEELPRLSQSDCWNIFKKRAFVGGDVSSRHREFEEVGRKIVEKLNGLPLAVDVVGNSLLNELDFETWSSFLDNKKLVNLGEDIMPALKWSYDLLPSELKPCFAYCSLFPKDHLFEKEDLIRMWMAHDFVKSDSRNQRPEDVGSDYLKKLLNASLLQPSDSSYVKMHDMIHDLARLVSNDQYFMIDDHIGELNRIPERARHLLIHKQMSTFDDLNHKRLLSFYYAQFERMPMSSIENLFIKLKFTRILVLNGYAISKIPNSIGKLRHIRYLNLELCDLESIPESVGQLHFLQTLRVPDECSLPRSMGNLIHLRHLIGGEASVNTGVGKLTLLQELSCIKINDGENIAELQYLDNLHGNLEIVGLDNIQSQDDAMYFNMKRKEHIRVLRLEFNKESKYNVLPGGILNALQPPPLLEELEIEGYMGWEYPLWMNRENLRYLKTLLLFDTPHLEVLPHLGEFDFLEFLRLESVLQVKKLGHEFYGRVEDEERKVFFPSLTQLIMRNLPGLKEWDGVKGKASIFSCLQMLELTRCPLLKMIPFFQKTMEMKSLTEVEIRECGSLLKLEMKGLVSLKLFLIHKCSTLVEVSLPDIPDIEILILDDCPDLISLSFGLQGFSSLRSLAIISCPKLPSSIVEFSSSSMKLEELQTDNVSILSKLLQYNLSSLTHMIIQPNSELTCFSMMEEENWQRVKSLRELVICDCHNLVSLPSTMNRFTSLDGVVIRGCPQLLQLPDCGFPPSLKSFSLIECLHLLKTCEREVGIDWPKIKHIDELDMIEDERECFTTENVMEEPRYYIKWKNSSKRYHIYPGDRQIHMSVRNKVYSIKFPGIFL